MDILKKLTEADLLEEATDIEKLLKIVPELVNIAVTNLKIVYTKAGIHKHYVKHDLNSVLKSTEQYVRKFDRDYMKGSEVANDSFGDISDDSYEEILNIIKNEKVKFKKSSK